MAVSVSLRGGKGHWGAVPIRDYEKELEVFLGSFGIDGDFSGFLSDKERGSGHKKGVRVHSLEKGALNFLIQPGDNGTRFFVRLIVSGGAKVAKELYEVITVPEADEAEEEVGDSLEEVDDVDSVSGDEADDDAPVTEQIITRLQNLLESGIKTMHLVDQKEMYALEIEDIKLKQEDPLNNREMLEARESDLLKEEERVRNNLVSIRAELAVAVKLEARKVEILARIEDVNRELFSPEMLAARRVLAKIKME